MDEKTAIPSDRNPPVKPEPHIPTSMVLQQLLDEVPTGRVKIGWLMQRLHRRSFGIVLLLLGICALVPGVSLLVGLLLFLPALQMMRAHEVPDFPKRLARQSVSSAKFALVLARAVPTLRFLERFVRPRLTTPFPATQWVIACFILLLGLSLWVPLPLSNVPVGLVVILMAFAHLEGDGLLLGLSLIVAMALMATLGVLLWNTVAAMVWLAS